MEHAMTVRAHDREIAEPRRSHAGLLGKWDGVVAFDVSGTVPPIDGPGPRQSRDSSRLSDDPTSWSGTTRLRWSRPGARFKRQAWSDIWCRPRLCRGPGATPTSRTCRPARLTALPRFCWTHERNNARQERYLGTNPSL